MIGQGKGNKTMPICFSSHWQRRSWWQKSLRPLSLLYYGCSVLRNIITVPYRAKVPVICVGNVTVGGAGKTPFCIALGQMLMDEGRKVSFVSRGYGGRLQGPIRVEKTHGSDEVGDEPLLLCEYAPVFVAKKRALGIEAAVLSGAEVVILDDGLQNPTVAKDISFLVIDGLTGMGNGYMLPAGPLREPLSSALSKVNAVVLVGEDKTNLIARFGDVPVLRVTAKSLLPGLLYHKNLVAFAGIGYPEKFFDALRALPCEVMKTFPFPDHYAYQSQDIERLIAYAAQRDAQLVTTQKDMVRIPEGYRTRIQAIPMVYEIDNSVKELFRNILMPLLSQLR